ncbi:hypothetical protein ACLOJK_007356 [Asimina triloba]
MPGLAVDYVGSVGSVGFMDETNAGVQHSGNYLGLSYRSLNRGLDHVQACGYLVIESFSSPEELKSMRERMAELLDGFDVAATASVFSTKNQVCLLFVFFPVRLLF